jgi:putative pyoverdin transport system ATP-binding/permease protein
MLVPSHFIPGLLALIGLAACSTPEPAAAPPTAFNLAVDSLVAQSMADGKVPGMAITIVRNDSVLHSKGYGFADLAAQRPMTDTTPVVIGSTSKTFTAFALMQLVDAGKVALDSSVTRYVKVMQSTPPVDPRVAAITSRHLLTNVSGLPLGFSGDPYGAGADTSAGALERLVREDMLTHPLVFAPGSGFTYSNRGFSLAALVVQDASGLSYEDYMAQRVFAPLGMRHSTAEFWRGEAMGRTLGYREDTTGKPVPRPPAASREWTGSGMLTSTAADVGTYLRMLLRSGKLPDGTALLSEAGVTELLRPQQKGESELGGPTTYALGWEVNDMGGMSLTMKGGSVISMGSLFVMIPQQKLGIAIVFNLVDYGKVQLLQNLLALLAGAPTSPYQVARPAQPVTGTGYRMAAARLASFAGDYMTRWGLMRVRTRDSVLTATYEANDVVLEPASDTSFIVRSLLREQEGTAITVRPCGATTCLWMRGDSSGVKLR